MFRAPFLAPSPFYGGKQCCPEEGCLVTQADAELCCCLVTARERPLGLGRLCAGLRLQLPVHPHLLCRRSPVATGLVSVLVR
jgi:hypothetical protein